jgi:ATP-dependent DNA ligase
MKSEQVTIVENYKKQVCGAFIPLRPEEIDARIAGNAFQVSRKYDGILALIFWDGKTAFIINTGGKQIDGIPPVEEAAKLLKAAKLKEAVIAAELYVDESKGRKRISDVNAALADAKRAGELRLAPFDIVSINGAPHRAANYAETHGKLTEWFGPSSLCAPVRIKAASSKDELKAIFAEWVEAEGSEGLVIRSELPMVYKVKPKYSIDAAVVGFTEGAVKGQVRALLFALMSGDGDYQIIAHGGGGLSDELKQDFYKKLSKTIVPSNYIETDSTHVAFRMVKPEIVVELSANDVIGESSAGPLRNGRVKFESDGKSAGKYTGTGQFPGVSLIAPVFERIRDDKQANPQDIRLAQVMDLVYSAAAKEKTEKLASSELLAREVYKKESGTKLMVQKFLAWKTNKEKSGSYPAYVMSYSNFSSERADPLTTDVRISNDKKQIMEIYKDFVEKNVKKGWEKV